MNILLMTIPISITLGVLFILFFLSAVKNDQFEDLETPAQIPFSDDEETPSTLPTKQNLNKQKTKNVNNNRGEV